MSIQWFPGHMTKAKRQMEEALKGADMVIELRDARVPLASTNPLLDELCQNKPRIVILTKCDKADDKQTEIYKNIISKKHTVLCLDTLKDKLDSPITKACLKAMEEKHAKQRARGINPRATRAMVVGIPNVGKSTLINRLSKKKVVKVADMPGVTRSITVITINKDLCLLDTPGVLWPKFDDEKVGYLLGVIGSINDDVLPLDEICYFAIDILVKHYPEALLSRYNINTDGLSKYQILEEIGKYRNDLDNNTWDKKRTIDAFLKDLRDDKLGKITWEYYE